MKTIVISERKTGFEVFDFTETGWGHTFSKTIEALKDCIAELLEVETKK